jgi:hypothetical protein
MYWMASWSPSQSLPLMVSYACQRQSSSVMFPRAALIPPWAATVCERVGNSLVMHLHGTQGWGLAGGYLPQNSRLGQQGLTLS